MQGRGVRVREGAAGLRRTEGSMLEESESGTGKREKT